MRGGLVKSLPFSIPSSQVFSNTGGGAAPPASVYATWNPSDMGANISLSLDDSRATAIVGSANSLVRANAAFVGKTYYELGMFYPASTGFLVSCGVADATASLAVFLGQGNSTLGHWAQAGSVYFNDSIIFSPGTLPNNSITGIAIDSATRKLWIYNNTFTGWIGGGDPTTGASPTATLGGTGLIFAAASPFSAPCYVDLISNPALMTGSAPSGFTAGIIA